MVKVGQKVRINVEVLDDPCRVHGNIVMRQGTVVFVSPKKRFHTVAVPFGENILHYTIEGVG